MCTDGVTDNMSFERMCKLIASAHSTQYAVERLVHAALKHGSLQDDATVLVYDVGNVYRKKTSWGWLTRSPSNSSNSGNSDDDSVQWTLQVNTTH